MEVRWGNQEMQRQAGASAEQGMDTIAAQQGAGMVGRSMTSSGIGIASAPSQDGSTIDDQIAGSNQMATHGTPDGQHKEGLKRRGSCGLPAFAQLRRAGNTWLASGVQWQATSQGQGRPTLEPLMHILVGESPKGFEQGDQQQRLFAVGAWATPCAFGQRRWAAPMRHLNRQAA